MARVNFVSKECMSNMCNVYCFSHTAITLLEEPVEHLWRCHHHRQVLITYISILKCVKFYLYTHICMYLFIYLENPGEHLRYCPASAYINTFRTRERERETFTLVSDTEVVSQLAGAICVCIYFKIWNIFIYTFT